MSILLTRCPAASSGRAHDGQVEGGFLGRVGEPFLEPRIQDELPGDLAGNLRMLRGLARARALAGRRHLPRGSLEELRARRKTSLGTQEVRPRVHPATDLARTGRLRAMQQVD